VSRIVVDNLSAHAETVAIVGADVWTNAADAPVKNATMVVVNGRIASVGAGASAPPGARVVQAAGKIITPNARCGGNSDRPGRAGQRR